MKRFFSSALIVCATLAVGLTGCQNDKPVENPETDGKNVAIKLFQSNGGGTRAVGTQVDETDPTVNNGVADDELVNVESVYIYFTTGSGDIVDYIVVDMEEENADEVSYSDANNEVGFLTAQKGFVAAGLPASVIKVIVAGNVTEGLDDEGTYPTTGNVYTQLDEISLKSQYHENGGVANVTLFGEAPLELVTNKDLNADGDSTNDYQAEVELKPIAARIEINGISAASSNIISYDLRGIFINGAFIDMAIDGSAVGDLAIDPLTISQAITYYPEDETSEFEYGDWNNYLANYTWAGASWITEDVKQDLFAQDPATTYGPIEEDTTEDVWAYNLLVPDAAFLPHIVIMVENVVVKGNGWVDETNEVVDADTYKDRKFLTISNYYWPIKIAENKLTTFNQGDVYRFGNIAFNEDDLTTVPEAGTFDALITIVPLKWNVKELLYDFD